MNTERGSSRRLASDQFDEAVSLLQKNKSPPSVPDVVSTGCSSPGLSQDCSVSLEDAMSICNSTESSDLEGLKDNDPSMAASLHWWGSDRLHFSDSMDVAGLFAYQNWGVLIRIFMQCLIHFGFTGPVYCCRIQLEET